MDYPMQQQYEQPWGQQQQPHGYPPAQDAMYGGDERPKEHDHDPRRSERGDRGDRDRERDRERRKHRSRSRDRERRRDRDRGDRDSERRRRRSRSGSPIADGHDGLPPLPPVPAPRSRSRERERRHRDRSRDRERRRRSRSRSRSREVVPINLRKPKLSLWDMPPPGYEGMTCTQVKALNIFPVPGIPKAHQPQAVAMAAALAAKTQTALPGSHGALAASALGRQQKRLYVGNIPPAIAEDAIVTFFNSLLLSHNLNTSSGNPVIGCQLNMEKSYAFIEFRSAEEATACMSFDGITFQGSALKLRRPKDYIGPTGEQGYAPSLVPGVISSIVLDSPNKLFVGGLPTYLNEEQVMDLLKSFGELKAFNLIKDLSTGISKGFAFCEYLNPDVTDIACEGLNGMELGDKKLVVQRASVGSASANQSGGPASAGARGSMGNPSYLSALNDAMRTDSSTTPTRVLLLLNMVSADEVEDDVEYEEIIEDIRDECEKFGQVVDITIPRQKDGLSTGIGKVFVFFASEAETQTALNALAGRNFAERTVVATFFDENKYYARDFA